MENTLTVSTLHNLIDYDVSRFISAEVELKNIMPKWINAANSLQLKNVMNKYLDYVTQHVQKLEEFYDQEGISSLSIGNRIMLAYIEEANEKLAYCKNIEIRDACLLSCVQVINHFKISIYGTAAAFATALGMKEWAKIFHEAETNEKQVDENLSYLAEHEINVNARSPIVLTK